MTALLDFALTRYRALGCPVFPIARDKSPRTYRGFKDATTDEAQLRAWFENPPHDTNIAIHCRGAGWVVLDIDPRNGGLETLAALEAQYGSLPRELVQQTHDGGLHIVMRDPGATHLFGNLNRFGKGIDIKWNGYIVAEPSIHECGHKYEWIAFSFDTTCKLVVPEIPSAWMRLIVNSAPTTLDGANIEAWKTSASAIEPDEVAQLQSELRALGPRQSGKSTTLKAIKRVFHDFGRSIAEGVPDLLAWNDLNGAPHDSAELVRQMSRVSKLPSDAPRGYRLKAVHDWLQDVGADFAALYEQALIDVRAALGTTGASHVHHPVPLFEPARTFMGRKFPAVPWLVWELLKEGGTGVVGAEPKACKTWVLQEIARALATGTAAFGHFKTGEPKRGAYFFAEDLGGDVQAHFNALGMSAAMTAAQWELFRDNLHVQPRGRGIDVMRDEDLALVVASCRRFGGVAFVCLEPLRDIQSGKEDTSDDMSPTMKRLRIVGELLNCTVLIAHHNKKGADGDRGGQALRGSGAIHGAIDSGIYLTLVGGDHETVFKLKVESEVKGARSGGKFTLTLMLTDGPDRRATAAAWTYEKGDGTNKAAADEAEASNEGNKLIAVVRAHAAHGQYFSPTAWEHNSGLGMQATRRAWARVGPAGTGHLKVVEWHPTEHTKLPGKGSGYIVPSPEHFGTTG